MFKSSSLEVLLPSSKDEAEERDDGEVQARDGVVMSATLTVENQCRGGRGTEDGSGESMNLDPANSKDV